MVNPRHQTTASGIFVNIKQNSRPLALMAVGNSFIRARMCDYKQYYVGAVLKRSLLTFGLLCSQVNLLTALAKNNHTGVFS